MHYINFGECFPFGDSRNAFPEKQLISCLKKEKLMIAIVYGTINNPFYGWAGAKLTNQWVKSNVGVEVKVKYHLSLEIL